MTGKVCPIAIKMWVLNIQVISGLFFSQSFVDKIKSDVDFTKKNYEEKSL